MEKSDQKVSSKEVFSVRHSSSEEMQHWREALVEYESGLDLESVSQEHWNSRGVQC